MNVLKDLRISEGYTQRELADLVGVSRQSILSYEKGAKLSLNVAKKIAAVLKVDYMSLIENKAPKTYSYNVVTGTNEKDIDVRIDIPEERINKFKEVLLYILNKIGAKPNVGRTVIYKLLYFIDFDYYELFEEQLMGLKYIKNNYGPTPVDFAKIIEEMEANDELEIVKSRYFNREQTKYLPLRSPDLSCFNAREIKHIDNILHKHSDKSARELSNFSHLDVPWIGTKEFELIPYESVFYRTAETSVRQYDL